MQKLYKLTFIPAGHRYYDGQEPRALTRMVYFYSDPARLVLDPALGSADVSFGPHLFFEDPALCQTALKLTKLIESAEANNRLYLEALILLQ
ncbi:MAG: hypothetical protein ABSA62_15635 [Methyloceanibacter sp.]